MKNVLKISLFGTILFLSTLISCKKEEDKKVTNPPSVKPQEKITTVILKGYNHDMPDSSAYFFTAIWEDLDGDGGNAPRIDTLSLDTGIEYHTHVLLIDKTKTPWDTVSKEIEELKNIHQFFYTPSASLLGKMEIEILDFDNNPVQLPVGLEFHMNTLSAPAYQLPVAGSLNMVLSHYDGIPKTTARSPESDIDISFPVKLVQ